MENPNVPESSRIRFRARIATRWSDEDNQGVVNNAVYMTLFEEARYRYFHARLDANHFPFLLAQTNVRFVSPGRGGEDVEVECATTELGTTSFTQAYRVLEASTRRVLCEAEARLVCYDPKTNAKRPIPPELRAAIEACERGG
ncbi:MAG: acyl-CoA thioesterase [Planctomycetes bacterium]|nr:acyl-CoA thioesterase [Planctomycetota bacterium]